MSRQRTASARATVTRGDTAAEDVRDRPEAWEVVASAEPVRLNILTLRTDEVRMPEGDTARRDYVRHPGSVGVLAIDDDQRVLLIRQYRHPVRSLLWEIPAGLRDIPGEPLLDCARRELAEETGHRADTWHLLLDLLVSPGASDERIRIFLARGLMPIPEGELDYVRRHEEADIRLAAVPLAEAAGKVLSGMIHNSSAVAGILAAYAASADGFASLRPADAPEA
ncbi:NUDIX hydrolase [Spongiactinospora sp. TRM90649]|uniref:NUDIX domain-containing protein n=1 Tax=Spongiactinospora sp. TRM90649 TaxID=3031114 RepID=UPI0023F7B43B|nr:NUDIX hydrolase [Spongiactinospora sp. TRM90649]MDF5755930.1 NUDIX hydrolase [Spongiactinospora sp. TRM90649]